MRGRTASPAWARGDPGKGRVYLVGAGPGDPELLTLKAARLLQAADVILYDRLVNPRLLEMAGPRARRVFVGKRRGAAALAQSEISGMMVEEARAGSVVVRLKGGDPFVFGRGGEEALALTRHGVPFEVVPGVSSALAVPAYAGIPLTLRGRGSSFTIMSGELHPESEPHDWKALARTPTLVVLMGLRNLPMIAASLVAAGKPTSTPLAVIRGGTTDYQQELLGSLGAIPAGILGLDPPAVVVIGEVVKLSEQLSWFRPAWGARAPACLTP